MKIHLSGRVEALVTVNRLSVREHLHPLLKTAAIDSRHYTSK